MCVYAVCPCARCAPLYFKTQRNHFAAEELRDVHDPYSSSRTRKNYPPAPYITSRAPSPLTSVAHLLLEMPRPRVNFQDDLYSRVARALYSSRVYPPICPRNFCRLVVNFFFFFLSSPSDRTGRDVRSSRRFKFQYGVTRTRAPPRTCLPTSSCDVQ